MVQNLPTLIFFFLISCNFPDPTLANPELRALMDVKAALDPGNKFLTTWRVDQDPCKGSFEGIACNDGRKVANISLQGRRLAGKLSPAIGDLKDLSGLYLHYNSISGEIPREIASLTHLTDLYLNFNNFTGAIPSEIGRMSSLQEMDLCCNHLRGIIPSEIGWLNNLDFLSLQYNDLSGVIPQSLGNLSFLKRLTLSYNRLSGPIPTTLANIQHLQTLDVRNNSLSGVIPTALRTLDGGFLYGNNTNLCGKDFPSLRSCTTFDTSSLDINKPEPFGLILNNHTRAPPKPQIDNSEPSSCGPHHTCSNHNWPRQIAIVTGVITAALALAAAFGFLTFIRNRRHKQKVGNMTELSECGNHSIDHRDLHSKSASPLVSLAHSSGWDPLADGSSYSGEFCLQNYRYNMEEVESASQHFSEGNLLGKGKFSSVHKGVLRDGSNVAIKSINVSSCKIEEEEFVKGMKLLVSLRHHNLVCLRGFCCSTGRGECFLVYDFAPNGNLLRYLDSSNRVLSWSNRVKIIHGIARGLHYLHEENATKPSLVHQNISAEKILIDSNFNPVILDSGLRKILADDTIFSAMKISAAMGYLAPEYITTGRFTRKSDVYSFGVVVLHIVSGKQNLTNTMRSQAESWKLDDLVDEKLNENFEVSEALKIVRLGLSCTKENPDQRPYMEAVIKELNNEASND